MRVRDAENGIRDVLAAAGCLITASGRGLIYGSAGDEFSQRAVMGAVDAAGPKGAGVPMLAAAVLLPPVTASPPVGTNMAWLKVVPVGALAIGRTG